MYTTNTKLPDFCDSGVSLRQFCNTNSAYDKKGAYMMSDESFGLSEDQKDNTFHNTWHHIGNEKGITLEELSKRSVAQKLRDLDDLDWRSQVPYEVDEGYCSDFSENKMPKYGQRN